MRPHPLRNTHIKTDIFFNLEEVEKKVIMLQHSLLIQTNKYNKLVLNDKVNDHNIQVYFGMKKTEEELKAIEVIYIDLLNKGMKSYNRMSLKNMHLKSIKKVFFTAA